MDLTERLAYILIIVQRDTTQNSLFIILQVHSTFYLSQLLTNLIHKIFVLQYVYFMPYCTRKILCIKLVNY